VTSNIDIAEKVRPIDVFLFDDVDLLDVLGSLPAFGVAVVNGRKRYEIRYVSLDGGRVCWMDGRRRHIGPIWQTPNTKGMFCGMIIAATLVARSSLK